MPNLNSHKWIAGEEFLALSMNQTGGNLNLRAEAQASPNMTLKIKAGIAIIEGQLVEQTADTNTGTFTAPGSNKRIDLVLLDRAGALSILQGVSAASPVVPAIPTDKVAVCAVYLYSTSTSIVNADDSNTAHGYIYQDLRHQVMNRPDRALSIERMTAGEAIAVRDAVIIGDDVEWEDNIRQLGNNQSYSLDATTKRTGQSFTTPDFTTKLNWVDFFIGSGGTDIVVDVFATDGAGKPTGSSLGSVTVTSINASSLANRAVFSSPITLSPSTKYAVVFKLNSAGADGFLYTTSDLLAGGNRLTSTNSGSAWTNETDDLMILLSISRKVPTGSVYKADGDNIARLNAKGIALTAASANGDIILVATGEGDIIGGFTSLTVGREYWLQDTAGTIGLTPSTTANIKIGEAVSTTELKLRLNKKYRRIQITFEDRVCQASTTEALEVVAVGFRPTRMTGLIAARGAASGSPVKGVFNAFDTGNAYGYDSFTGNFRSGIILLTFYDFNGPFMIEMGTLTDYGLRLNHHMSGNVAVTRDQTTIDCVIHG